MKIFEFAFNPKKHKDRFFEVFSYEPSKPAEKSKGSLYVVGELDQALEFNARFLRRLSATLQGAYYASPLQAPAPALKAALKEVNSFLAEESRKGNVDWLGNLQVAILIFLTVNEKKTVFHLAKTGTMKAHVARRGSLVDVGKKLEATGALQRPGSVFGTIVSGNLVPGDSVLVQSREVFDVLSKEKALGGLGTLQEAKAFKDFFAKRSRPLSQSSGVLVSFVIEEEQPRRSLRQQPLFPRLALPKPRLMLPGKPRIKVPSLSFQLPWMRNPTALKKRGTLLALFLALLLLGFLLFQGERNRALQEAEEAAQQIELLQLQAENALVFEDRGLANELFQEAWAVAAEHAVRDNPFQETFLFKKQELEAALAPLNNIRRIEEPELLFEITRADSALVAQDLLLVQSTLYVTNPFSSEIFSYETAAGTKTRTQAAENLKLGTLFQGSPLFFASPNLLLVLDGNGTWQRVALEVPAGFTVSGMESFQNGLYLLDKGQGTIVRYLNPLGQSAVSRSWLAAQSRQTPKGAVSFAIDGNIWVLLEGKEIQRYFTGAYQESLEPLVFPQLEQATSIKTSSALPHLYVLDPTNQRLLILTKFGEVVRQYQSPKFTKLLDAAISSDGTTAYLLNGQSVYRITGMPE